MTAKRNAHRPGYKPTDIAWIPDDWDNKTIEESIKFSGGSQPPQSLFKYEETDGYIRLIQTRDYRTDKYKTYIPLEKANKTCNESDIMIGRYGPPLFQIFRGIKGAYNVALIKAIPDNKLITQDYCYYYLSRPELRKYLEGLSQRSGGQTGIEMDKLNEYPMPLPPLNEQHKISEILIACDNEIETLNKIIEKKEILYKGITQQLLTGKKRLPGYTDEWNKITFKDFLIPTSYPVPKPNNAYSSLGLRSHGKGTLVREVADPSTVEMDTLYEVKKGQLILNITFAWEGAIAILEQKDEGKLVSHRFPTYQFNSSIVISNFFKYIIKTKKIVFYMGLISPGGAGRNRVLDKHDFLNLSWSLPSVNEQQNIAAVLSTADEEISILKTQLEALKNQKKGLMQKLLTGEVRVKA